MTPPAPRWEDSVFYCDEACPLHDGKRCERMGARPFTLCEPAVKETVEKAGQLRVDVLDISAQVGLGRHLIENLRAAVDRSMPSC